jgi:hypothetical protein
VTSSPDGQQFMNSVQKGLSVRTSVNELGEVIIEDGNPMEPNP